MKQTLLQKSTKRQSKTKRKDLNQGRNDPKQRGRIQRKPRFPLFL